MNTFPRGIEVLIKKAAVDAPFRGALLVNPLGAADSIGLALSATEKALLAAMPAEQLAAVVQNTKVPEKIRPAFRGYVAAAMLAALGVGAAGCIPVAGGARPDVPAPTGARPDLPPTALTAEAEPTAETADTAATTEKPKEPEDDPRIETGMRPDRPDLP